MRHGIRTQEQSISTAPREQGRAESTTRKAGQGRTKTHQYLRERELMRWAPSGRVRYRFWRGSTADVEPDTGTTSNRTTTCRRTIPGSLRSNMIIPAIWHDPETTVSLENVRPRLCGLDPRRRRWPRVSWSGLPHPGPIMPVDGPAPAGCLWWQTVPYCAPCSGAARPRSGGRWPGAHRRLALQVVGVSLGSVRTHDAVRTAETNSLSIRHGWCSPDGWPCEWPRRDAAARVFQPLHASRRWRRPDDQLPTVPRVADCGRRCAPMA